MTATEHYLRILDQSDFENDPTQISALKKLDLLAEKITPIVIQRTPFWWNRIFQTRSLEVEVKGIYFWGGVGRGKTFLMDLFYQSLTISEKRRFHFHDFINQIHHRLKNQSGVENPLELIANDIASQTRVICLDEFVIIDIADAMIMSGLLKAMFKAGVVLVTTSNAIPANLYRDGLQRARFLPAIALLEEYCEVINLDSGTDYRLRGLKQTDLYMHPHSDHSIMEIEAYLTEQINRFQIEREHLEINGRFINFVICYEDTVWFTFANLCESTRSQNDYLELSRLFKTFIISDIKKMTSAEDDVARRFVLLIDILYDHRVKLICSAQCQPFDLYTGTRLTFEFERTSSRLIEMQSDHYLSEVHVSN
ncbi:MAG: cell division protein ZapE [Gammaproteobacteria bacterium]|jgi:cell division protein ZapE